MPKINSWINEIRSSILDIYIKTLMKFVVFKIIVSLDCLRTQHFSNHFDLISCNIEIVHFKKENDYFEIGSWGWLLHTRKHSTYNTYESFAEFYIIFLRDSIHARILHHICFMKWTDMVMNQMKTWHFVVMTYICKRLHAKIILKYDVQVPLF